MSSLSPTLPLFLLHSGPRSSRRPNLRNLVSLIFRIPGLFDTPLHLEYSNLLSTLFRIIPTTDRQSRFRAGWICILHLTPQHMSISPFDTPPRDARGQLCVACPIFIWVCRCSLNLNDKYYRWPRRDLHFQRRPSTLVPGISAFLNQTRFRTQTRNNCQSHYPHTHTHTHNYTQGTLRIPSNPLDHPFPEHRAI